MARFFERGDPAEREQRGFESKLADKISQRDAKGVQLRAAEAALAERRSAAEVAALESDESRLDAALQARRSAEDKVGALSAAIGKISKEISEIEAQIDRVVDQRCRSETSIAVTAMADRIAKAQASHEAAALELELAAKEGGLLIPESVAVHQFVLSAREQLVPAVEMVVGALRQHARAVVSGHAPVSLPRPAAPPLQLKVVQSEPMVTLFVTKNIRYINREGGVTCCGQNRRHDLPERIGALALAANAAVTLADKKRIQDFEGMNGMLEPHPSSCIWVGPKGREPEPLQMRPGGPPPIHSSLTKFTPMDRGGPFTIAVPRGPEPEPMPLAVGAHKLDEETQ